MFFKFFLHLIKACLIYTSVSSFISFLYLISAAFDAALASKLSEDNSVLGYLSLHITQAMRNDMINTNFAFVGSLDHHPMSEPFVEIF